jgi:hypothetical protein
MPIPSTIIFPLPERVASLQRLWREHEVCGDELTVERYTDEVIDAIVSCLDHYNVSDSALMTFAMSDKHECINKGFERETASEIASEIHKLGEDFQRMFTDHMLYLNGKFDYVYSGRCSNKEIILIRYN